MPPGASPQHDPACWGCGDAPGGIHLPHPVAEGATEYDAWFPFDDRPCGWDGSRMIKRIVLAGVLVLALMIAVKDGRVLRETGLTGVCTPAQSVTEGVQLEACRAGK